ncbi:MAG: IS110 family transposase [Flavobacteriales bacterium]
MRTSLGIDCSKQELIAYLGQLTTDHTFQKTSVRVFRNTLKGVDEMLEWAKKRSEGEDPIQYVIEATGVYYEDVAHTLIDRNEFISVILPNKVRAFARSLNLKIEDDKTDAMLLSKMGAERKLDLWDKPDPTYRQLRQLTRERTHDLKEQTILKNRLEAAQHEAYPNEGTIRRLKSMIDTTNEQIEEIEREIKEILNKHRSLKEKVERITTIKGVGLMTVVTVVAETNGFNLVRNKKQLVSYAGYDVWHKLSGTSVNKKPRVSKKGNIHIRRVLHFPAINMVKWDEGMHGLYQRLYEKNNIKMKGYVAVQRKVLVLIYTLWKKDEEYDPNFEHQSIMNAGRKKSGRSKKTAPNELA